jgi:hypothetical protein
MAVLVPCLTSLRAEFDRLAPDRDRASDGWIADGAHVAGGTSDHIPDEQADALRGKDADDRDEVHALDVDRDLRARLTMMQCVAIIVTRHRTGQDNRLQNVIFNRMIWSRSWGWTARAYGGTNPHDKHAHFSARYETAHENDTRPWGLLEEAERMEKEEEDMTPAELLKYDAITNTFGDKATNPTITVETALENASRASMAEREAKEAAAQATAAAVGISQLLSRPTGTIVLSPDQLAAVIDGVSDLVLAKLIERVGRMLV